jgi:hypothetical protein
MRVEEEKERTRKKKKEIFSSIVDSKTYLC